MAGLYPNLHEKFRDENVCPICLYELEAAPRYSCDNGHRMCHRCKPYYYSCPTCKSPLELVTVSHQGSNLYRPPPATHYMPHPHYPNPTWSVEPNAPFMENERLRWEPPVPTEDQELYACRFAYRGCCARVPEHLRILHESRCQHHTDRVREGEGEDEPSDRDLDGGSPGFCRYRGVGCNVRLTDQWRREDHEKICIYKDRADSCRSLHENLESLSLNRGDSDDDAGGNPEEMIDCKFRRYGCMVRMPRRRKRTHMENCNYNKYHHDDDDEREVCYVTEEVHYDPEEAVACRWSDFGCQVQPRRYRKETHEEKCNYRRELCRFSEFGCCEMVEPPKRYLHEQRCSFAC